MSTYAACTELLVGDGYKQRVFEDKLRQLLSGEWERCAKGSTITVNGIAIARERRGSWTAFKNGKDLSWSNFVLHVRGVEWLDRWDDKKKRKHFAIRGTDCDFDLYQGAGWQADDFTPYVERAFVDRKYAYYFINVIQRWCDWPCAIAWMIPTIILAHHHRQATVKLTDHIHKREAVDVAAVTDLDTATKTKVAAAGAWIEAMRSISGPASKLVVECEEFEWDAVDMTAIGEKIASARYTVHLRVRHFAGARGVDPTLNVYSAMNDLIDAVSNDEMPMTVEAIEAKLVLTKAMSHTPGGLTLHQTFQVLSKLTANK